MLEMYNIKGAVKTLQNTLNECIEYHLNPKLKKPEQYAIFLLCLEYTKYTKEEGNVPDYIPQPIINLIEGKIEKKSKIKKLLYGIEKIIKYCKTSKFSKPYIL